jgi:N-acylglucosamine-6-phosphate 2-epimerase
MSSLIPKGIIVSCQSEQGSAFYDSDSIVSFAKEAQRGGAIGLRIRGYKNVLAVKSNLELPVIGLTKSIYKKSNLVLITPNILDAKKLKTAGADYIAFDATGRNGLEHISESKNLNVGIIGDISSIDEADKALNAGCNILTTALSGYTERKLATKFEPPDFEFLESLIKNFNCPIIAEGRYWDIDQVKKARDLGARGVVIGSAITRPHLITEYFNNCYK